MSSAGQGDGCVMLGALLHTLKCLLEPIGHVVKRRRSPCEWLSDVQHEIRWKSKHAGEERLGGTSRRFGPRDHQQAGHAQGLTSQGPASIKMSDFYGLAFTDSSAYLISLLLRSQAPNFAQEAHDEVCRAPGVSVGARGGEGGTTAHLYFGSMDLRDCRVVESGFTRNRGAWRSTVLSLCRCVRARPREQV